MRRNEVIEDFPAHPHTRTPAQPALSPPHPIKGWRGAGGDKPAVGEGRTSTSRDDVRLRPRSQARWRMRQCFRTASRDAYSRAHPGCLHVKRCTPPTTVILQQSTAAMPLLPLGSAGASPPILGGRFFGCTGAPPTAGAMSTAICHEPLAALASRSRAVRTLCCGVTASTNPSPEGCAGCRPGHARVPASS